MTQRSLYIAAYDVSDDRRLRAAHRVLKAYASGCQKSVFECYLTDAERHRMLAEVGEVIDPVEDRFFAVRLDPRGAVRALGRALPPGDPSGFYVV